MPRIDFYFDYISPYAFLAWHDLLPLADELGATVRPIPTLLAGLLNHHGNVGPAEIPAKRRYVFIDCVRHARARGLELAPPPSHPFNPLLALRVSGLGMSDDSRQELVTRLFDATWSSGRGVEDPRIVAEIAAECGVGDAIESAESAEAKSRLRRATESAIECGVFGVPSMVACGELFWGLDSLSHLRSALSGGQRVDESQISRFAHIKPSASR